MSTRDLTPLCRRMAQRYIARGYTHPMVAAVATAVRGRTGLAVPEFASLLQLETSVVEAAESGELSGGQLPAIYWQYCDRRMADLIPVPTEIGARTLDRWC